MIPPEKVPFSLSDDQLDGLYGDRLDRLRAAIESGDRQRLIDTHYELFQEPAPGFANGNGNGHHNGVVVVPDPREVQLPPAASTPDRYADRFFELDAIERLLAEPPKPKRWRVHGFAIDATLTLLSGEAGAGKSILMDNLCSGVAHGRTVAGMPCVKGTALYVDGEMGVEMFFDRYRDTGRTRADFRYVDALGLDLSITKPDDLGWVRDQVDQTGAQFVVIDSLRRMVPSRNENDSDDMAPALAALAKLARDTRAAIVVIHHKGDGEKFYRGSSAIRDQVDALFGLIHVNPDDDEDRRVRLTCRGARAKAPRSAGEQPDRYLEVSFKDGGVKEADAPESAGPMVPMREAVAAAIEAAMPVKYKKEAAEKIGRRGDDKTFRDAWDDLERTGRIVPMGGGWSSGGSCNPLGSTTTTSDADGRLTGPGDVA